MEQDPDRTPQRMLADHWHEMNAILAFLRKIARLDMTNSESYMKAIHMHLSK